MVDVADLLLADVQRRQCGLVARVLVREEEHCGAGSLYLLYLMKYVLK